MWSPWHYTGQNFGVLMMFLRRAGVDVSAEERRRLHLAFLASFVMLLAAFNAGPSTDPLVLSLGLPPLSARIVEAGAGLTFLAGGLAAFAPIARRAPAPRAAGAADALLDAGAVVRAAGGGRAGLASIDTPQTRYSSGMLAVMHSAQYLWITRYFAKRDAEQAARAGGWSPWRYWTTLVAGGIALFLPVPWLASYGWHLDFTASVFIVAAIVNLHHFMIDGVVWKLRNPRVGRVLVQADRRRVGTEPAAARERADPAADAGARRSRGRWRIAAGRAASPRSPAIDQWRYVLAIGHGERERLVEARRASTPTTAAPTCGWRRPRAPPAIAAAAAAALRRAVDANPQNPVLAQRAGAPADRGRASSPRPIAQQPGAAGALAGRRRRAGQRRRPRRSAGRRRGGRALVDAGGRRAIRRSAASSCISPSGSTPAARPATPCPTTGAISSSWRGRRPRDRPDPREVVAVVVKFGDALARDGQVDVARTQYDLAIRMAAPDRPGRSRRAAPRRSARPSTRPGRRGRHGLSRTAQNRPPSTRKLCAVQAPPSSAARNSTICANSSA